MAPKACRGCPPKLLTAGSVAFFAFVGVAIRVALAKLTEGLSFGLTTVNPSPSGGIPCHLKSGASGYFLQNIVGCILMAAIARHKKSMNEFLAVGLSSGLCGSLTTFATWMGEEAATIVDGQVFEAFVSVLSMLCVSLTSYRLGHFMAGCGMANSEDQCFDEWCGLQHCIIAVKKRGHDEEEEASSEGETSDSDGSDGSGAARPGRAEDVVDGHHSDWGLRVDEPRSWREPEHPKDIRLHPIFQWMLVFLGFVFIIAYICFCVGFSYWAGLLDLAMAPAGALLRWYLSLHNGVAQKACCGLPIFTLIANLAGVACNSVAGVLGPQMEEPLRKAAVGALSTGFAGSLSTVSTLVSELRSDAIGGLRVRTLYFALSFGLAMAIELPVLFNVKC
mmetsp:Transcript_34434/g.73363  ORF Transcript_34434/g.73363 Transcript_34434/m.73363 type:complete len:391 (-) Transcript_34434:230-1402(-)|eukprot:CAMPEP_0206425320 /NCGR_PEP_ID=MMETSP0324_2-20121206/3724_1 /ASSEMBLY_ACC=CAM_ASM_000836 /TAXON_ID=2866 /ORGANISM="Crypthecodinium cohnii, Strain Seligo" /LENGTH=390 /DNA_ID=CAMNT_0053890085 /DNA_START=116 /DNA_END=1288 /DNA_ORIENTATION=-